MGVPPTLTRLAAACSAIVLGVLCTAVSSQAASSAPDGLRPLADAAAINFGAAVQSGHLDDTAYRTVLESNVNVLSTRDDLSFAVVQPTRGTFDFRRADAIVDFAVANDMIVRGHDLITPTTPQWVRDGNFTADELTAILAEHVTTVIEHYRERNPGVVTQWDVVANAVLHDGSRRPSVWQDTIGDGFVAVAFQAARAADPDAQLFYDDFYDDFSITQDEALTGATPGNGATATRTTCDAVPKCTGVQTMVAGLVGADVPIDGVGFQAHLFSPDPVDFTQFSAWVPPLGLRWAITEFDVPLPSTETANDAMLDFQAAEYEAALGSCVTSAGCDTFVTWGATDRLSPIPQETGGAFGGALWLDANDAPKPAFAAIAGVLGANASVIAEVVPPTTDAAVAPTVETTVADPIETSDDEDDNRAAVALVGVGALVAVAAVVFALRRRRAGDPA